MRMTRSGENNRLYRLTLAKGGVKRDWARLAFSQDCQAETYKLPAGFTEGAGAAPAGPALNAACWKDVWRCREH